MLWSLISLNLQYYNLKLLSYSHSQIMTIFQPLPKETAKYYCVALTLSIPHTHFLRTIIL